MKPQKFRPLYDVLGTVWSGSPSRGLEHMPKWIMRGGYTSYHLYMKKQKI